MASYSIATGTTDYPSKRKLARTSDGSLHAVFGDGTNVKYSKSTDDGENWSTSTIATNARDGSARPSIASDSEDNLHVVFINDSYDISYIEYNEGDSEWKTEVDLTNFTSLQIDPMIAVDSSDNLHVAWRGRIDGTDNTYNLKYIKKTTTWGSAQNLTTETGFDQQSGMVVAIDSNDYVHIVWEGQDRTPDPNEYSIRHIKYDTSWSSITDLGWGTTNFYNPSIAIDSNDKIHIVYNDTSLHGGDIKYVQYDSGFGSVTTLESGAGSFPTISIDNNDIHVVWVEDVDGTKEIYYKEYTDSWQSSQSLISEAGVDQENSSLIYANYPNGNIPTTGFAFLWEDAGTVYYYASDDLSWVGEANTTNFFQFF